MAKPKIDRWGLNVQVVGQFNPRLFVPSWFASMGLLRKEEAETANIEIIHAEIAQFSLDWLNFQVTQDRLVASTSQLDHTEVVRDLLVGSLNLLSHTPTRVVGINHDAWLTFSDQESWHEFGWVLAPPANWGSLKDPGMASLTMQGARTDDYQGYVRVMVRPVLDGSLRCHVNINDHYEVSDGAVASSTPMVVSILDSNWLTSSKLAAELLAGLKGVD